MVKEYIITSFILLFQLLFNFKLYKGQGDNDDYLFPFWFFIFVLEVSLYSSNPPKEAFLISS